MPAYLFVFEAQPTRAAVPTEDIAGAMVHVWVVWKSLDEAERHAREFVRDCDWVIDAVTHRLQPTDAQIARLEDSELGNYNRALRAGISADFIAWPKRASRTMSSPVVRPVSADWKKRREAEYWSFESAHGDGAESVGTFQEQRSHRRWLTLCLMGTYICDTSSDGHRWSP